MEARRINYKSDFDFILNLKTCQKAEDGTCSYSDVGWPSFDWTARLWTNSPENYFEASFLDGECTNCYNDNGKIHIVCNNHGLESGTLRVEFLSRIPNDVYPDGVEDVYEPQAVGIELVRGAGDCATVAEIEYIIPYATISAYELAVEQGYEGTRAEYLSALASVPQVTEALEGATRAIEDNTSAWQQVEPTVMLLSDLAHGKAELAGVLRSVGRDVSDDAPLPVMTAAVRSLDLTPADPAPGGVTFADFGMSAPVSLIDVLHRHQKAGYQGCVGITLNATSVRLAGADAYLTSDGVFREEPGTVTFERFMENWVIYYFRDAEYSVPDLSSVGNIENFVAYSGTGVLGATSAIDKGVFLSGCLNGNITNARFTKIVAQDLVNISGSNNYLKYAMLLGKNLKFSFSCSTIISIELPDCETLLYGAYSCRALTRFYAPKARKVECFTIANATSLTLLDMPALEEFSTETNGGTRGCSALRAINMPRLEKAYPYGWKKGTDNNYIFFNLSALETLSLPSLKEFAGLLCGNLSKLSSLSLPSITTIHNGSNWLYDVPKLATVNLGAQQEGRVEFPQLPVTTVTIQPGYRQTLHVARLTSLTEQCLHDIVTNLGDNTDRPTITLTLGETNIAKLAEEDVALAQAKNFTLV